MSYFAKNIYYLRKQRDITQAQIPDYVDISRGTWSNYEVGRTEPSLDQLIEIAKFLRVSIDDLLRVDLEEKGKVIETGEVDENGKVNGKPIGKVYSANDKFSLVAEDDINEDSKPTDLVRAIKQLLRDVEALKRK